MKTQTDSTVHSFTLAGMGNAPFQFLYVYSLPSPSLAEQNPSAYQNALAMMPRDLEGGCGTCSHCGMAIMNIYVVKNAEGKKFGVGCDCIAKHGDSGLVSVVKLAKRKADREKREAIRAAKWEADRPAREARIAEAKRIQDEKLIIEKARKQSRLEAQHSEVQLFIKTHGKNLESHFSNNFYESLALQIFHHSELSFRQWEYVAKWSLQTNRVSKATDELVEQFKAASDEARNKFKENI